MSRSATIRPGASLAAVAAVVGILGCGTTPKPTVTGLSGPVILDTGKVAQAIEQSILTQRHIRATASCPSGVLQRKGLTFPCLVTYAGGRATFVVNQLDDKGNVHYAAQ